MPTLCALNGGVYGGATDLALACDFRLGVRGMKFFMPAARFGLHYYPGGLRRYTQKVSPSFAKRAFLLSEDFSDDGIAGRRLSRLAGGTRRIQGQGRREGGQTLLAGAAVHGQHEARDRAVRPGRARYSVDPRRHPASAGSEDLREGLPPCGSAHARLQGTLTCGWAGVPWPCWSCRAVSPRRSSSISRASRAAATSG